MSTDSIGISFPSKDALTRFRLWPKGGGLVSESSSVDPRSHISSDCVVLNCEIEKSELFGTSVCVGSRITKSSITSSQISHSRVSESNLIDSSLLFGGSASDWRPIKRDVAPIANVGQAYIVNSRLFNINGADAVKIYRSIIHSSYIANFECIKNSILVRQRMASNRIIEFSRLFNVSAQMWINSVDRAIGVGKSLCPMLEADCKEYLEDIDVMYTNLTNWLSSKHCCDYKDFLNQFSLTCDNIAAAGLCICEAVDGKD